MPHTAHIHFVQAADVAGGGGLAVSVLALHRALLAQGQRSHVFSTVSGGERFPSGVHVYRRFGRGRPFYARGLRSGAQAAALKFLKEGGHSERGDHVHANLTNPENPINSENIQNMEPARGAEPATADTAPRTLYLHVHGFFAYSSWVAHRLYLRLCRLGYAAQVRIVCHPHGFFEPWALKRSPIKKQLAGWLYEGKLWQNAHAWRALSTSEAEQIRSVGLQAPIVEVPNGVWVNAVNAAHVDASSSAAHAQGAEHLKNPPSKKSFNKINKIEEIKEVNAFKELAPGKKMLLYVGRFHAKKALPRLVHAFQAAGGTAAGWQLVLCGAGSGAQLQSVQRHIAQVGAGGITCLPWQSRAGVQALLGAAQAFVLPSVSEGLPMAVLEALASGLPTVATGACHVPQLADVRPGCAAPAGWLCEATEAGLASALGQLFASTPQELAARTLAARALAKEHFSAQVMAQRLVHKLQGLV